MFKYCTITENSNTNTKTYKHNNDNFILELETVTNSKCKINTDILEIKYYVNFLNKTLETISYQESINLNYYFYDKNILGLLFNYKQKDTIIKKLYETIIKQESIDRSTYIFNYLKNKEGLYYTPILDFYISNKKLFGLIIDMLHNIINHPKANNYYNPRPSYISSIDDKYINHIKTESKTEIIDYINDIYTILLSLDDVLESNNKYKFQVECEIFQLSTIAYHILLISVLEFNKYYLESITIPNINSNITIYKVNYNERNTVDKFDTLLDKEFKNIGWHGSNLINWYSIFYNGLVAGTKKQGTVANGTAYGEGIYISDTSSYSLTYSSTSRYYNKNANKDNSKSNNIILGLFQIEGGLDKYKKCTHIFVIPNSELVCMRYLVVGTETNIRKHISILDNYFIKTHTTNKQEEKKIMKKKGNGRIMKEIKMMDKYNQGSVDNNGLEMKFNVLEDQINIWRCQITKNNFTDSKDLFSDFNKYNIESVEFEVLLPERYPFEPPFIRIVSPRFEFLSGHITRGGSICMELLTKQGWTSSVSIDKVLLMIKQNIMDGNARIDSRMLGKVYGYREAVEAYDRMLRNHPEWNK
jgi:ubiquitin-protein ligase